MQYADLLQLAGDCRHTASAIFKYFREHTAPHLFRGLHAIDVQHGRRDVVDARLEAHQTLITLDSRASDDECSRHFVTVGKIMLGDDWCGAAMVHVHVRIFLELTQWFDPMVRNDEDIGVVVDVLQNHSQDFIETAVLVGESINRHGIDLSSPGLHHGLLGLSLPGR